MDCVQPHLVVCSYNGIRSLLKVFNKLLGRIQEPLIECLNSRDNLLFNADGQYDLIADFGVTLLERFTTILRMMCKMHQVMVETGTMCKFIMRSHSPLAHEVYRVPFEPSILKVQK
eukprot:m.170861 g.170861  ORF g.170861 m.170861 type:complete len:116 (-) comp14536_c0_seq17:56-403(-)